MKRRSSGCITMVIAIAVAACSVRADAAGSVPSLQELLDATNDSRIIVPAGVYRGPVIINRALELIANGSVIIDAGGEGDGLRITAADVTVRGFTIRNTGDSLDHENAGITVLAPRATLEGNTLENVLFGIYLKNAPNCVIRDNTIGGKLLDLGRRGDGIRLWYSPRAIVERNTVTNSRDVVMWFSTNLQIRDNHISHGRYGLHFMYSHDNVLEGNRLTENSVGAFLMYSRNLRLHRNFFGWNRGPSGYGVGLKDMDGVIAKDNVFLGNRVGISLDNSPSSVDEFGTFTGNMLAHNDIGVALLPSVQRNRFSENLFIENIEQVAVLGGGMFRGNDFTVDGRGNYWSDYAGYDLDGDGVGDTEYRSVSLFETLIDREPKLRLFLYGPAQQAIELASRSFPVIQPRAKFEDIAPLMQVAAPPIEMPRGAPTWQAALTATVMIACSACVLIAGRLPLGARSAPEASTGGAP